MLNAGPLRRRAASERGFTMIELIVAMAGSVAVLAAAFMVIATALHQSTRTLTKVDATQRARVQVELLMNELHSACTAFETAPIQAGSTGTSLIFTSAFGDAADPTPVQHQITFNPSTDTLTDTTTSGTKTLLTNVSEQTSGGTTTPVFQYFSYEEPLNAAGAPYTDGAGNDYMILLDGSTPVPGTSTMPANDPSPLSTPLSANDAATAVEVVMTLVVGPSSTNDVNTHESDADAAVDDSAIMRLTSAPNHAGDGASFGPCQ